METGVTNQEQREKVVQIQWKDWGGGGGGREGSEKTFNVETGNK